MTRPAAFHKSWLEPRFDARDVTPPADPIGEALARYLETEREIFEAHRALIADLSEAFTPAEKRT